MKHYSLLRIFFAVFFVLLQLMPSVPAKATSNSLPAVQSASIGVDAQMVGGIIYVLLSNPPVIKRYDTIIQTWMSPIPLPETPTAFRVDGSQILVALGKTIARFNVDGTGRTDLWTGQAPVAKIVVDPQFIFACQNELPGSYNSSNLYSINRATGAAINGLTDSLNCDSITLAPGMKRIFARTKNVIPSDVKWTTYNDQGMLREYWDDSPYNGAFPHASKLWIFPDESQIVENTGTVYGTANLDYRKTIIGDEFQDFAFYGDQFIMLRNGSLFLYDERLIDQAVYKPGPVPEKIFVAGDSIYALRSDASGPQIDVISTEMLQPYTPADPVDAFGLPYAIDGLAYDPAGVVYLMNKDSRNIFRWSVASRAYLDPIPLLRTPQYITFAPELGRLYIGYETSEIVYITPAESLEATPFSDGIYPLCNLTAAGNTLVVCSRSEGSNGDFLFTVLSANGIETDRWLGAYYGPEPSFAWSSSRRIMFAAHPYLYSFYWFGITPEGAITNWSGYDQNVDGEKSPLRVSNDETKLFVGPEYVFNLTPSVTQAARLPYKVTDAAWFEGKFYTLRESAPSKFVELWNASFTSSTSRSLLGDPKHLISTAEGLLAITQYLGHPRFTLLDGALNPLYDPPAADFNADPMKGFSPLRVQFMNLSENNEGATYLWDFGDGETSTEANPEHTYIEQKKYTVTLTVTGASGSDRIVWKDYVHVLQPTYLPSVLANFPQKAYVNACKSFPMVVIGYGIAGTMTECVTAVQERTNWRVFFTWKPDLNTSLCIDKWSDLGNPNMYMKDQYGNRYNMVNAGDAALGFSCMTDDHTYTGWFDFPKQAVVSPIFTFYDDDNGIQIGSLAAP